MAAASCAPSESSRSELDSSPTRNDDAERSVRHILHYGSVVKLSEVCAQKRMFAAGGQQSVYGSVAARKRALERERSKLLRKAMAVAAPYRRGGDSCFI